jgi:hypothetical protein
MYCIEPEIKLAQVKPIKKPIKPVKKISDFLVPRNVTNQTLPGLFYSVDIKMPNSYIVQYSEYH